MPELQMLANGFALQHSLGEDVNSNIADFKKQMQFMYAAGEFKNAVQSMLKQHNKIPTDKNHENLHDGAQCSVCHSNYKEYKAKASETAENPLNPENNLNGGEPIISDETHSMPDVPSQELILDEEARANVEEAKRLDEEDRLAEEQLVKEHNLPYPIPNRNQKYIIYEQGMRSGGSRKKKNPPPPAPARPPAPKQHRSIIGWGWENADIIWTNGGYQITHHIGLVITDEQALGGNPDIIDANTDAGVKRHPDLDTWAKNALQFGNATRIEGLKYAHPSGRWMYVLVFKGSCNGTNRLDVCRWEKEWRWVDCPGAIWNKVARKRVAQFAINMIRKPYNYDIFDKTTQLKFYCSQLVWQAYLQAVPVGSWNEPFIDLDSDGGFVVTPDDIKNHKDIKMFNSSIAS